MPGKRLKTGNGLKTGLWVEVPKIASAGVAIDGGAHPGPAIHGGIRSRDRLRGPDENRLLRRGGGQLAPVETNEKRLARKDRRDRDFGKAKADHACGRGGRGLGGGWAGR